MCKCKYEIEQKLLERFKKQNPNGADHAVELIGYGLFVTKSLGLVAKPFMNFETKVQLPLKKGGTRLKKEKSHIVFNYCPFCGEKIEQDTQEAA